MGNTLNREQFEVEDEQVEEMLENRKDFEAWNKFGATVFAPSGETIPTLTPGLYRCAVNNQIGPHLIMQDTSTDVLIDLGEDSESSKIIREIEDFWEKEPEFKKRGLLHKRGILMSGDPGSGKTSTIQILIKKMVTLGGVVLYPHHDPEVNVTMLHAVRRIQPTTPICMLMEDFEVLCRKGSFEENRWLSILDGECQVDNIVFLATTNYIEHIDKRFTDRPSRFDTIRTISMPTREQRERYLNAKEPDIQGQELEDWLDMSEGFAIAHLKEMIVAVKCLGQSLDDAVDRLSEMQKRDFSSEDNTPGKKRGGFKPRTNKGKALS